MHVLSLILLFVAPWTVDHQAPLSMEFFKQEHWSRLPFPPLGDLPDPGTEPASPGLVGGFFTTEPLKKPMIMVHNNPFNVLLDSDCLYFVVDCCVYVISDTGL